MTLKTLPNYSPNFDTLKRTKKKIKFIILHYTGMKKESTAIKKLSSLNSKVSCHYFIKDNGRILTIVPNLYESWHAGISKWKKIKSLNKYSIGIEINNPGHEHGYKSFSSKQIKSLKKLLKYLIKKFNISYKNVLGHSDIAPDRKKDPGEKFPWRELAKEKLAFWHKLSINKIKFFRNLKVNAKQEKLFLLNLIKIGYSKIEKKNFKKNKIFLIKAFQRRFRQELINGKIDKECLLISKNLIKS
jgi:N-acetylmuramoyl-L-alanine amidase